MEPHRNLRLDIGFQRGREALECGQVLRCLLSLQQIAFAVGVITLRIRAVLAVASEALFAVAVTQGTFAEQVFQGDVDASKLRG
jgi:hypothetical protein